MNNEYQICKRCVMDTTDPDISFDKDGYCNHCTNSIKQLNEIYFIDPNVKKEKLNKIVSKIRVDGKGNKYDCIIGLSGGVDSSYLAYVAVKELGLRPLAIHLDNGWNSELSVKNIENIVEKLRIDLYTQVLDWNEFKGLQLAFLRASVIDIELLTDHAIGETLYRLSKKWKLKYFLSGFNCQSETVMPSSWLYPYKNDSLNIKDIFKKHGGSIKLKTYNFFNFYQYLTFGNNKMKLIPILNYVDYQKEHAISILERELNWRNYGNKHEESIFTKFYQCYILPKKFYIDKRKAHLSSLICSNQISRDDALDELRKSFFKNDAEEKESIEYFCKKLGLSIEELEEIMKLPRKEHNDFKTYARRVKKLKNIAQRIKFRNE